MALVQSEEENILPAPSRWDWLGPCASLLCIVHCFSLPFILLIAPGFLHRFSFLQSHEIELVFWIFATLLGFKVLRGAACPKLTMLLFLAVAAFGPVAYLLDSHPLMHAVLMTMATLQFFTVLITHIRERRHAHQPPCCDHAHHQSP